MSLYSGYCFVVTGSLPAVILSRIYLEYFGKPDFDFLEQGHQLHGRRYLLMAGYISGFVALGILGSFILNPDLFNSFQYQLYKSKI